MFSHELKLWVNEFDPVWEGVNSLLIPRSVAKPSVGDKLDLFEITEKGRLMEYTGRAIRDLKVFNVQTEAKNPGIKIGYTLVSFKVREDELGRH